MQAVHAAENLFPMDSLLRSLPPRNSISRRCPPPHATPNPPRVILLLGEEQAGELAACIVRAASWRFEKPPDNQFYSGYQDVHQGH